jgi:hypothetical protein
MDRLGARLPRRLQQALAHEIALRGRAGPDEEGFVGGSHVHRLAVRLGIDGDRPDAELAERAKDPHGDLAAVRHEDFREDGHRPRILSEG